jgi:CBS-domain-containing membrane protein/PII-like signaling protein
VQQYSRGTRVQIYCGETDQVNHRPLYQAILEYLRKEGAAGATVSRGIAGFGRASLIQTAAILRLSMDLPVVITWIDAPERVERLLPGVQRLAASGVITVDEVGIASYGERAVGKMRFDLQVRDVMTRDVHSITDDAPIRAAVEALVGQVFRALPVVDAAGHLVGLVTNSNLVERGGLEARIELLNAMSETDRESYLDRLPHRAVSTVMTTDVVTVRPPATLAEATRLLSERHQKRLPVVEPDGRLVGMLSRADVLRAVAEAFPSQEHEAAATARPPLTSRDVMRTDLPVVSADAGLPQVVDAVCSTRLNRAIVVDDAGRVVGVVSDAAVLRALGDAGGGLVGALMRGVGIADAPRATARDLMTTPAYSVEPDATLSEVARVMTEHGRKIVPVVDAEERLLGVIDRADLLHATHGALRDLTDMAADDED